MGRVTRILTGAVMLGALLPPSYAQQFSPAGATTGSTTLAPTDHPRFSRDPSKLWLAPDRLSRPIATLPLAQAVKPEAASNYDGILAILSGRSLQEERLAGYAAYYKGLAELDGGRAEEARSTFRALVAQRPVGFLAEAAALGEAKADEALGDAAAALAVYEQLSATVTTQPDTVLLRLAQAASLVGDTTKATAAYERLYYDFPTSDLSAAAGGALATLPTAAGRASVRFTRDRDRAERLFAARRYDDARRAFQSLRRTAQGDDLELVRLRLAECDYFLKRIRAARDGVRPLVNHASRQAEVLYFYALTMRAGGGRDEYVKTIRRIVTEHPTSPWAEDALNHLASRYIIDDDDARADEVFREMYERFPRGRFTPRAAWKIGWFAYRQGQYSDAARVFDRAAAEFPRSDYRPMWLYWSGRAHAALKAPDVAEARFTLVATDYLNSYYGRLAVTRLNGHAPSRVLTIELRGGAASEGSGPTALMPPNEPVVRALLAIGLHDDAANEVRYAQKVWGDSPVLQATLAWIAHERGELRAAINAMKRAYPQYMAAGGERLPTELLRVVFPLDYWPLIRRHASERQLDPYVVAALIAQESTFIADVRSPANAYGLMQLLPSTGRRYARVLQLKRFSVRLLTNPETNIRMGTAYLADLVNRFRDMHLALASYNAGEHRVVRWIADHPDVDRDEFIDDIPFPETQNYVKRILGTADDYRRLYPEGGAPDVEIADTQRTVPDPTAPVDVVPTTTNMTHTPAMPPTPLSRAGRKPL